MNSARRRTPAGTVALLLGGCALLLVGCAGSSRPGAVARAGKGYESPSAHALPESDPSAHGTVQGARGLTETEQVAVRLGRAPDGKVVLLQVLSPDLSPQQQEALRRGFEAGEWQREAPVAPAAETWIENIVRTKR